MPSFPRFLVIATSVTLAAAVAGCGSNSTSGNLSPTGSTVVSLLLSSSSNNHLSQFNLNFSSISLTSKSGKTVTLLAAPQNPEFVHLNGNTELLLTASVPQDDYTSASAAIPSSTFVCIDLNSTGGLQGNFGAAGLLSTNSVSINLPSPITISGSHMGLLLNLQVTPSISFRVATPSFRDPQPLLPHSP